MIPFTTEQFLEVFSAYNRSVFPLQIFLALGAFVAIFFAVKPSKISSKIVAGMLTFLWMWMGIVYHWIFFSEINKLAYLFGILFIVQALIFFFYGVIRDELSFCVRRNFSAFIGTLIIIYGLIIYPILGFVFGHIYPESPTFGLPCPTTIFTFGLLLWTDRKVLLPILLIPIFWSLVSLSAALSLGINEDFGLVLTGFFASALIIWRNCDLW